ncbi:MAG: type III pantothenate kinase, partial [Planctomycetota bacterium]
MHLLSLDVGNTTVRAARLSGSRLLATASWPAKGPPPADFERGWTDEEGPEAAGIASVNGKAETAVLSWLAGLGVGAFRIPADLPYPIPVALERPESVGPDRVLASAAALDRVGGPCIVVDAGTAVTVDFATPGEGFRGGMILPGRHLMARALRKGTSRLPEVAPEPV